MHPQVLARPADPAAPRAPSAGWLAPLLTGAAAAVVAGVGAGRPALWRDEVASIAMAEREPGAFLATVAHVDAVHALYYALLHAWFAVVPVSATTLRLPSVLAVGATAAVVTLLGRRLDGARAGVVAGALCAVLPSLHWAGGEGRSSAGTALLAAVATLALLHALEPRSGRRAVVAWAGWAALLALGAALFVDALLLVPAHLVTVLLLDRRRLRTALLGAGAAVLAVAPLVVVAATQAGQISWIARYGPPPLWPDGVVDQWFRAVGVAQAWAAVLLVGLLVAVLRGRTPLRGLGVALPWAVLPPVLLVAAGIAHDPVYWPRYVLFTAPAVALTAGLLVASAPLPGAVAGVAALALVATPQLQADRLPRAKAGSELELAADLVARSRGPGDGTAGVLFGQYEDVPGMTTRIEAIAYPAAFRGLVDLAARVPLDRADELFGEDLPVRAAVARAARLRTVWVLVSADARPASDAAEVALASSGFHETGRRVSADTVLERWTR